MSAQHESNKQPLPLWKSKKGILLQVIIVILPSVMLLKSGTLLLAGVACSLLLSWIGLRLQKLNWSNVGLKKPTSVIRIILIAIIATLVLLPLSLELRNAVTSIAHEPPDLHAFKAIEGNLKALAIGLIVVWIFGAFAEEMLFRGFLTNSFYKLFPEKNSNDRLKWSLSLLLTSILVAFGHSYQRITGMIITGVLGFCFGLIYLMR